MNMYTNTKKSKKFILILVLLMLFNFMCPRQVNAGIGDDIAEGLSSFFFFLERGIIRIINDLFCDEAEEHKYKYDPKNGEIQVKMNAESIIKGKFVLLDANIFKQVTPNSDYYDVGHDWMVSSKNTLRETIAGWYYNLLNFAIVALLSVLVYVGIRMITSTISQDKAKYKIMFKDWVVAICLLIAMHYIMIGVLNITTKITDAIGKSGGGTDQTAHIMSIIYNINEGKAKDCNNGTEDCRYEVDGSCYTIADAFGQELLLLCIVILTIIFLWKYLKRMFTIVFLILLGPISCITYPIDKISDGKAQAFNKWLTEFIYNVLIQPFHLLLYLVLVGSATKIASENLIYALACLGMLIPAEKFIKEMFGFKDKLGSPLGAMATGAIGSQMLSKMKGGGSGKPSGGDETTPSRLPKNKIKETDLPGNGEQPQLDSGDSGLQTIEDSPTEYDSDDTGNAGGASAASAYQDSNNPIRDAEREALAEKLAEGEINKEDLTDDQKILLGDSALEDYYNSGGRRNVDGEYFNPYKDEFDKDYDPHTDYNNEEQKVEEPIPEQPRMQDPEPEQPTPEQPEIQQPVQEQPKRDIKAKPKGTVGKLIDRHSTRMAKKYNSTSRGQRWINRGKKLPKTLAKTIAKPALGFVGGAVGFAAGVVSGKGVDAALGGAVAGAAIGSRAVDKTIEIADKAIGAIGEPIRDYADALKTPEQRENKALNEFRADHKQQDKARLNFIDKNGVEPSSKELDNEMIDRFALSRAGLSDSQIDDAVGEYQKLKASGNFTEKEALAQSVFAARYADMYKGKFSKTSDMKEALAGLTRRLEDNGYQGNAELKATEILQQAADMKREDFALKLPGQTITMGAPTQTTTRQQVDIDVQEGAVDIRTNRNSHNTREINARLNFRENTNNNVSRQVDNSEPEVKIGKVDTGRVQSQISSTRTRRQSVNKNTKSGKKDIDQERLTNIKAQEAIDNNLDIKAGKKAVEEKGKRQLGSPDNQNN